MKSNINDVTDDALLDLDTPETDSNTGCQVRRRIEDYLEQRRYKDELGELEDV